MISHCCLVIFAVAVSFPALAVHGQEDISGDNSTALFTTTPKPFCRERPCPRMYRPVCGVMGDQEFTASSRCVLRNKMRCAAVYSRALKTNVPPVRYLHKGPCRNERRSVEYMRDEPSEPSYGEIDISLEKGKSAEKDQSLENGESAGNDKSFKSGENFEKADSAESAQSSESAENAESAESAEGAENAESAESAEIDLSDESDESVESAESVETGQPDAIIFQLPMRSVLMHALNNGLVFNVDGSESSESDESLESNEIESLENNHNEQAINETDKKIRQNSRFSANGYELPMNPILIQRLRNNLYADSDESYESNEDESLEINGTYDRSQNGLESGAISFEIPMSAIFMQRLRNNLYARSGEIYESSESDESFESDEIDSLEDQNKINETKFKGSEGIIIIESLDDDSDESYESSESDEIDSLEEGQMTDKEIKNLTELDSAADRLNEDEESYENDEYDEDDEIDEDDSLENDDSIEEYGSLENDDSIEEDDSLEKDDSSEEDYIIYVDNSLEEENDSHEKEDGLQGSSDKEQALLVETAVEETQESPNTAKVDESQSEAVVINSEATQ